MSVPEMTYNVLSGTLSHYPTTTTTTTTMSIVLIRVFVHNYLLSGSSESMT